MTSCYEKLDERMLETINFYRKDIIGDESINLLIKRNDFYLGIHEYLLVSLICDFPYLQMLILYGEGKKIDRAYLIIGNYYFSISRREAQKEIDAIRKYNGNMSNSRMTSIPCYKTTFSKELLESIQKLLRYYMQNKTRRTVGTDNNSEIFNKYIEHCSRTDEQRRNIENYRTKKLIKIC